MLCSEPIDPQDVARAIALEVQVYRAEPGSGPRALPSWARFYLAPTALVVVVLPGQTWTRAEQALAYGLHHSAAVGVPLVVAFPEEAGGANSPVRATLVRSAYLQPGRVSVWTYGAADGIRAHEPLTREAARALVTEDPKVRELRGQPKPLNSSRAEEIASALEKAVAELRDLPLVPTPRRATRTWTYQGLRVLSVSASTDETVVRTGVHSTKRGDDDGRHRLGLEELSSARLEQILGEVREACAGPDVAKESEQRAEHWFQIALPSLLPQVLPLQGSDLGSAVLREVPTRRPAGGTGFIDLLALDDAGVLHIIETKLGSDPMLTLQGLDYRIWVDANRGLLLGALGREDFAGVVIDYVLAGRNGEPLPTTSDVMGPYAAACRAALADDVTWNLHVADAWKGDEGTLRTLELSAG